HGRLGVRTFLHPVVLSAGVMEQKVEGWQGAPQTIYTDHFLETDAIDGPLGFKLEAPPLPPVIFASSVTGFGREQAELLKKFPNTHVLLALLRDGFHHDSPGGKVKLRGDGSPVLGYPFTQFCGARPRGSNPPHGRYPFPRRCTPGPAGTRTGPSLCVLDRGQAGDR